LIQNKSYLIALIVLVFWYLFGAATRLFLLNSLEEPDNGLSLAIQTIIAADLLYVVLCGVVIIARSQKRAYAKTLTRALNILLLFNFPFGTVLGLYGLIKVDK